MLRRFTSPRASKYRDFGKIASKKIGANVFGPTVYRSAAKTWTWRHRILIKSGLIRRHGWSWTIAPPPVCVRPTHPCRRPRHAGHDYRSEISFEKPRPAGNQSLYRRKMGGRRQWKLCRNQPGTRRCRGPGGRPEPRAGGRRNRAGRGRPKRMGQADRQGTRRPSCAAGTS